MSGELQLFDFHKHPVRVVMVDGEPWFVLADICRALGLTRGPAQVAERLDDGVRQPYPITDGLGRTQNAIVVSESGMYEVVIRSDKPDAVAFRRWITGRVLPAIRKTGSYSEYPAAPRQLPSKKELAQWVVEAEERAERAESRVIELTPPAAAWNELADSAGDYSVADAAKVLSRDTSIDIGERRLFSFMSAEGWIFKRDGRWRAYQAQVDLSRLVEKVNQPFMRNGEMFAPAPTIRITPKGLARLQQLLGGGSGTQLALAVVPS
jgi:anti-repressor protein